MNYGLATLRNLLLLLQIYKRVLIQLWFDHKHQDCRRYQGHGAERQEDRTEIHNPSVTPSCLSVWSGDGAKASQTSADYNLVQEVGEVGFF